MHPNYLCTTQPANPLPVPLDIKTSSIPVISYCSMATTAKVIQNVFLLNFRNQPSQNLFSCRRRRTTLNPAFTCSFSSSAMAKNIKIAIIGQSVFVTEVYNLIRKNGHTVVGVFTIPDKNGREVSNLEIQCQDS